MKAEMKIMGDITSRGTILLPINPDFLDETTIKSGNDIYVVYDQDMIIVSKKIDIVNMITEKNRILIVDKMKKREMKEV